jgi:hypothetical protein
MNAVNLHRRCDDGEESTERTDDRLDRLESLVEAVERRYSDTAEDDPEGKRDASDDTSTEGLAVVRWVPIHPRRRRAPAGHAAGCRL